MDIVAKVREVQSEYETATLVFADKSANLIKDAIRLRMTKRPYPKSFISAMGSTFFIDAQGNNRYLDNPMANTDKIIQACEDHQDDFGSLGWRIDREDGKLVEADDW